jgi:hypothetical protein
MRYAIFFSIILFSFTTLNSQPIQITRPVVGLSSSSNIAIFTMNAFAPAQNALLVLVVNATGVALASPSVYNSSGTALTWTLAASRVIGGDGYYIYWTQTGNITGNIAVRFDCTGDNATGVKMSLHQVIGYDKHKENPLRQVKINTGTTNSSNPNFTFDNPLLSNSAYIVGWVGNVNNTNSTPPSGWSESDDISHNAPNSKMSTARRAGGLTTAGPIQFTNASTTWVSFGIEIPKHYQGMPLYMF